MNAALFGFTARGLETAGRIAAALREAGDTADIYAPGRFAGDGVAAYGGDLPGFVGAVFDRDALIFVGACGIAVRAVAPHVAGKQSDPAVLCVDEKGGFVIALLSGHIGGANRLAHRVARVLGATPVITTATDVNGRFSVDAWAAERDMSLSDMALAKRVSAEILTRDIPMWAEGRVTPGNLPAGLVWRRGSDLGICVSCRDERPFDDTLLVIPRALRVGIGCRRGISPEAVAGAVDAVFETHHLRPEAVAGAASIDVKVDEEGLRAFCAGRGWPLRFYDAGTLKAVAGSLASSEFVKKTVGVDNVCERAALASGGRLVAPRTVLGGVTVAVAEMEWGIEFGEDQRGGHRTGGL